MTFLRPSSRDLPGSRSLVRFIGAAIALLTIPAPAAAHERWVTHAPLSEFDRSLFETVRFTNVATLVGILGLGALLLHVSARMRSGSAGKPSRFARANRLGPAIVGVTMGLGYLLMVIKDSYVAPDLVAAGTEGRVLVVVTGVVAALLLIGFQARLAGWASLARTVLLHH